MVVLNSKAATKRYTKYIFSETEELVTHEQTEGPV